MAKMTSTCTGARIDRDELRFDPNTRGADLPLRIPTVDVDRRDVGHGWNVRS